MVDVVSFNLFSSNLERMVHESLGSLEEVKERFKHGWVVQTGGQVLLEHLGNTYFVFVYLINLCWALQNKSRLCLCMSFFM